MRIGFIGAGNMARAIIGGIIKSGVAAPGDLVASAPTQATRDAVAADLGIRTTASNVEVVRESEVVVLAVKPGVLESVIDEISDEPFDEKLVVSIAAGKDIHWLEDAFGKEMRLVRTMPNTPALVGEGFTAICPNEDATEEDVDAVFRIFRSVGSAEQMSERMVDVVGALAGSSPAYVFMFIEALADAAVAEGMRRNVAYRVAAQAVLGSAKMVLDSGEHPAALKDMVCSPGGTTIEGVQVLEEGGMRAAVMNAIRAAVAKTQVL